MKTSQWVWIIALCAVMILALLIPFFKDHHTSNQNEALPTTGKPQTEEPQKNQNSEPKPVTKPQILWGIDTASSINGAFYQCVKSHYGKPDVVGRYLESKDGISEGMTKQEAAFLHKQGIKIIPVFNHFTDATIYRNGVAEANEAIAYAKKIGIPKGVAIFADIEPKYSVDDGFISGWVDAMTKSPYKPGIYGVFTKENRITAAYLEAAKKNKNVKDKAIIWNSNPEPGITAKTKAPKFQPHAASTIQVSVWQYGMDASACNIDTDLVEINGTQYLW